MMYSWLHVFFIFELPYGSRGNDTRNGRMWLVQFSLKNDKRFESVLSYEYLVGASKEVVGRFTLHPTKNSYNFILLDQIDGKIWQVQWSFDQDKRFVIEIN